MEVPLDIRLGSFLSYADVSLTAFQLPFKVSSSSSPHPLIASFISLQLKKKFFQVPII